MYDPASGLASDEPVPIPPGSPQTEPPQINESEGQALPVRARGVGASEDPSPIPHGPPQINVRWAGFWARGVAFLIDLIILDLLFLILALTGSFAMGISLRSIHLEIPSEELVLFLLGLYLLIWFFLNSAYFIFFLGYGGQTPGKMLLRIRVLKKDQQPLTWGRAVLRTLGYLISGFLLLGIGFLMIAFHPQKRGVHDLIAGTLVIHES